MAENPNPDFNPQRDDYLATKIIPRAKDLGGFEVRRALPSARRQLVGPFIFFDQMGPAEFLYDGGIDVRPHPHIGLATVTYLFQGEFQHRDSLGTDQMIYPGEVNWMIAGKGITHSERTSAHTRAGRHALYGIQTWVALPEHKEDMDPAFEHHGSSALPVVEDHDASVRVILGHAYGARAPVSTFTDMFYADAALGAGTKLPMPDSHEDRGAYVLEGSITINGDVFEAGQMLVFNAGEAVTVVAGAQGARLMLLGGETLNGPRYISWNFVSSSKDKIRHAAEQWRQCDWQDGPFSLPPGDEEEFIPLPETLAI
ncbi:MAG: pirin family protein [Pseudomonadota bacterium]